MKKYSMIFAACAMLMFAACNKDEEKGYTINDNGTVTFGVGLDNPQTSDKQAFNGPEMRSFFTTGDEAIVNTVTYTLYPRQSATAGSTSSFSDFASITVAEAADGVYEFFYPASTYTVDGDNYTATFPAEVTLMSELYRCDFQSDEWVGEHPIWPMYTKVPDINTFEGGLILKNAVSFLCPEINYGPGWANIVWPDGAYDYNNLPALHVTDFVVNSSVPLNGPAHLDYSDYEYPVMVMDAPYVANANKLVLHSQVANGTLVSGSTGTGDEMQATNGKIGMVPIAPIEVARNRNWQMNVYFWVTRDVVIPATDTDPETTTTETKYYKFVSRQVTGDRHQMLRGERNFLKCNFRNWTGDNTNRPQWNETENSLTLPNGVLYRSDSPFTVE
jgi:hypothetical protein